MWITKKKFLPLQLFSILLPAAYSTATPIARLETIAAMQVALQKDAPLNNLSLEAQKLVTDWQEILKKSSYRFHIYKTQAALEKNRLDIARYILPSSKSLALGLSVEVNSLTLVKELLHGEKDGWYLDCLIHAINTALLQKDLLENDVDFAIFTTLAQEALACTEQPDQQGDLYWDSKKNKMLLIYGLPFDPKVWIKDLIIKNALENSILNNFFPRDHAYKENCDELRHAPPIVLHAPPRSNKHDDHATNRRLRYLKDVDNFARDHNITLAPNIKECIEHNIQAYND